MAGSSRGGSPRFLIDTTVTTTQNSLLTSVEGERFMRYPGLRVQVVGVATGALVLALLPGAPGNTAARAAVRGQAEQRDADGRVVRSPTGKRFTYQTSPKVPRSRLSRARAARAAVATGARYVSTEPDAPSLTLEWNRAALGVGIGLTGLFAADVDADGTVEIVAGGGGGGFGPNQRWYVLSRQGAGYDQEFASLPYPSGVGAVRVAQMDADAPLEVVVGSGTSVFVYDGASHALERTLTLPSGAFAISSLAVADVDADGALEVVATDGTDVFILNAATGALEWRGTGVGGVDLAVGQIDADAGLEIVVANGASTGHVIDGKTHVGQWSTAFGRHVCVADLDGDGLGEVVAGFDWSDLIVYEGDTHAVRYTVPIPRPRRGGGGRRRRQRDAGAPLRRRPVGQRARAQRVDRRPDVGGVQPRARHHQRRGGRRRRRRRARGRLGSRLHLLGPGPPLRRGRRHSRHRVAEPRHLRPLLRPRLRRRRR